MVTTRDGSGTLAQPIDHVKILAKHGHDFVDVGGKYR